MIDITAVLSSTENVNIEAKLASGGIPSSIWETYSSFANTFGGTILLGVEEIKATHQLVPKGVTDPHKTIVEIWNTLNNPQKINNNILLESHVYCLNQEGKDIVVIEVPRADRHDKPIYVGQDMFKGTYRRNHEGDYHCRREEVLAMLRDQSAESSDSTLVDQITLSDLNAESIYRYRMTFKNKRPSHVWNKLSDEEFLIKIGAAKKGTDAVVHPTRAGLLFFGDFMTIVDEFPNYFLDYRERLSSDTRWSDRVYSGDGTWSGNIFDFYFKIIDRLTSDVKKPFQLDSNMLRMDETPIHSALREALANAIIHADYFGLCGIVIDKEFRKITISNPGSFRISVDAAIEGGISDARNARIFNMFSLIDVGERAGSGLCNLFNVWDESGFDRPVLEENIDPDRITLKLHLADEGNEDVFDGNEGKNEGNLDGNEAAVLDIICSSPSLSAVAISKQLSISKATVERVIQVLKKKGYIQRKGGTRGEWIVLK